MRGRTSRKELKMSNCMMITLLCQNSEFFKSEIPKKIAIALPIVCTQFLSNFFSQRVEVFLLYKIYPSHQSNLLCSFQCELFRPDDHRKYYCSERNMKENASLLIFSSICQSIFRHISRWYMKPFTRLMRFLIWTCHLHDSGKISRCGL